MTVRVVIYLFIYLFSCAARPTGCGGPCVRFSLFFFSRLQISMQMSCLTGKRVLRRLRNIYTCPRSGRTNRSGKAKESAATAKSTLQSFLFKKKKKKLSLLLLYYCKNSTKPISHGALCKLLPNTCL